MTLDQQETTVVAASVILYLAALAWSLIKRAPLVGGLLMLVILRLPIMWQWAFTQSDAPGNGLLALMMAPIPLLLIVAGLVRLAWRISRRKAR